MGEELTQDWINTQGVGFIDFGASTGGSLNWGERAFGGRGVGIDIDPAKVSAARSAGNEVVQADATKLDLPDGSVRFCSLIDFIEHLPDISVAEQILQSAYRIAEEFIFIVYPDFDHEEELHELGVKRYYADWSGHTLHLQSSQMRKLAASISSFYTVLKFGEIRDTYDRSLLPLSSPRNQSFFSPDEHGVKSFSLLPRKRFYTRVVAVLWKDPSLEIDALLFRAFREFGHFLDVGSGPIHFASPARDRQ